MSKPTPSDQGPPGAGASARREFERRRSLREARVKGRLGNWLGGAVLAITDDPASTRAWQRGATGEGKLAAALEGVPDLHALHDRAVPGTRANIDHILVAPAGVFVVDAKYYQGEIRVRDVGGLFRTDERLFVGRRDCSKLADAMARQVDAVLLALNQAGHVSTPVRPVLCFVEGEWPLLWPPESFRGVRLEGTRSIRKLITSEERLDRARSAAIFRALEVAFPSK